MNLKGPWSFARRVPETSSGQALPGPLVESRKESPVGEKDVGFIGLGNMGRPMARNLIKAGYSLTVYDVVGTSVEELVTDGAHAASSSKEVAQKSSVVITMVPDSADSEAAILGEYGVLEGASAGHTVIDMSSIAPGSSKKIASACESQGVDFLDAPVSGGAIGATNGTMAIMIGGKQEVFDRHMPLFEVLGGTIVLCGGYGAGSTTKLINQMIVATNIEGVAEGLVLARKAGLDPTTVFEAIRGGGAASPILEGMAPAMIKGDFEGAFRLRLQYKDLNNALLTGMDLETPLPVTALIHQMIGALINNGKGDRGNIAIANYLEEMANTTISGR
jgi:2-hydroxy-3-oxopropionate reductase